MLVIIVPVLLVVVFTAGAIGSEEITGTLGIFGALILGITPGLLFLYVILSFIYFAYAGSYLSRAAGFLVRGAFATAGIGTLLVTLFLLAQFGEVLGAAFETRRYSLVYVIGYCLATGGLALVAFHRSILPRRWITRADNLTGRHDSVWAMLLVAGIAAFRELRLTDAEGRFREALDSPEAKETGGRVLAVSFDNLATTYCLQGRYSEAMPLYGRSLAIWIQVGSRHPTDDHNVPQALLNLAAVCLAEGQNADAAALAAWASAIFLEMFLDECAPDSEEVETWQLRDDSAYPDVTMWQLRDQQGRLTADGAAAVETHHDLRQILRRLVIDPQQRYRLLSPDVVVEPIRGLEMLRSHLDALLRRILGPNHSIRVSQHLS